MVERRRDGVGLGPAAGDQGLVGRGDGAPVAGGGGDQVGPPLCGDREGVRAVHDDRAGCRGRGAVEGHGEVLVAGVRDGVRVGDRRALGVGGGGRGRAPDAGAQVHDQGVARRLAEGRRDGVVPDHHGEGVAPHGTHARAVHLHVLDVVARVGRDGVALGGPAVEHRRTGGADGAPGPRRRRDGEGPEGGRDDERVVGVHGDRAGGRDGGAVERHREAAVARGGGVGVGDGVPVEVVVGPGRGRAGGAGPHAHRERVVQPRGDGHRAGGADDAVDRVGDDEGPGEGPRDGVAVRRGGPGPRAPVAEVPRAGVGGRPSRSRAREAHGQGGRPRGGRGGALPLEVVVRRHDLRGLHHPAHQEDRLRLHGPLGPHG